MAVWILPQQFQGHHPEGLSGSLFSWKPATCIDNRPFLLILRLYQFSIWKPSTGIHDRPCLLLIKLALLVTSQHTGNRLISVFFLAAASRPPVPDRLGNIQIQEAVAMTGRMGMGRHSDEDRRGPEVGVGAQVLAQV